MDKIAIEFTREELQSVRIALRDYLDSVDLLGEYLRNQGKNMIVKSVYLKMTREESRRVDENGSK